MRFDLHLHTTASDGTLEPAALVKAAVDRGLHAIAITDHDTTAAVVPAQMAARASRLLVIPGVELSASHQSRDVHILGYFIRPDDPILIGRLAQLRDARLERAGAMVTALSENGYPITLDQVLALADGGSVGRSHVARALVNTGHVPNIRSAFENLIGRGMPFYVPKPIAEPASVVSIILDAGGIPILAHPGVTAVDDLIPSLVEAGLGGLEAFHADHSPDQRAHYARLASDLGLLVSGGSDFHGLSIPGVGIGEVDIADDVLTRLLAAAGWSDRLV